MKGIIKNMPEGKSFCFIRGTNGAEIFLHRSDFTGHWDDLVEDFNRAPKGEGIEVTFEMLNTPKGPRASQCRRLDFPNEAV